jgi:hypothetical protein
MLGYVDAPTKAIGWSAPSFSPSLWEGKTSRLVESSNGKEEEDCGTGHSVECNVAPHHRQIIY